MSVRHLAAIADLTGLSPACKLVLYGIAISACPLGRATLTYAQLHRLTGLSERALRNNVRHLEQLGYLVPAKGGFRLAEIQP